MKLTHTYKTLAFGLLCGSLSLLTACMPQSAPLATGTTVKPALQPKTPAQAASRSHDPKAFSGANLSLLPSPEGPRLRIRLASADFKTQAIDCGAIVSMTVNFGGIGPGMDGTTASPDGVGSCSFTTAPLPPLAAGRTRLISVQAYDGEFQLIGELATAVDIVDGQTSSTEINYRSTAMAKIFKALLNHEDVRGQVYATRIGIAEMQNWVDDLIGVDGSDSFPYSFDTHPLLLDAQVIANAIIAADGQLPDATPAGAIQPAGEVVVNLSGIDTASDDDLRVWIKDPASERVIISNPDASEVLTFDNVIPGQSWTVEVKQGETVMTQTVIPNSGGSTTLSYDLDGTVSYGSSWSLLPGGPYAGHINQIVADNGDNLIAATEDGGVYFSDDNGASWTMANDGIATADLDIDSLATNPLDATNPYVYAGTGTGKVFRRNFVANETTWTQVGSGTAFPGGVPINRLFVDRQDSKYVLAGGYYGGVAECLNSDTEDFTITNLVNSGGDYTGVPITGFTEDDSGNYYLASKGFGVYRTTTPGAPGSGWTQLNAPSDPFITSIDFDSSSDKLQLGSYNGRFYTGDAPAPTGWSQFTTGLSTGVPIWDILMGGNKIFAATYEALKKADDVAPTDAAPDTAGFSPVSGGADTYVPENPNSPFLTSLIFDPLIPGNLFAGTHGAGVHARTASSWLTANEGLHAAQVTSLAKWGATSVIYAGIYGGGVMRSTDGGSNWVSMLNVPPPGGAGEGGFERRVTALLLVDDTSTHDLLMGTEGGVYHLDNANGATADDESWGVLGASGLGDKRVRSLVRLDNETLLAGTETKLYQICMPGYPLCGAGSTTSWAEIQDGSTPIPVFSLAAKPDSANYPYAGTDQGVYYNTDLNGSGSWVVNPFGAAGQRVIALATTPADPNQVWAGLDPSTAMSPSDNFLYKNTGAGGGAWTAVSLPSSVKYVNSIVVSDSDASQVFIATNDGVYYSNTGGDSWTPFNDGAYSLFDIKVRSLAVDWANMKLFAGTGGHSVASTTLTPLAP